MFHSPTIRPFPCCEFVLTNPPRHFTPCGRQPGHYTRFGVTSGWPVNRSEQVDERALA
jgi:hypothetical protein